MQVTPEMQAAIPSYVIEAGMTATGATGSSSSLPTPTVTGVDPWAIALMCVFGLVAAIMLGYLVYVMFQARGARAEAKTGGGVITAAMGAAVASLKDATATISGHVHEVPPAPQCQNGYGSFE
jgi:hypothetical protein